MRSSLLLVAALALAACDANAPETAAASATVPVHAADATEADVDGKTLARIRRATARYHRVERALAAGYVPASGCVEAPPGGMGYHYVNFDLIDATVDPGAPEILLYEPMQNGKLRLVGVEFMVSAPALGDGPLPTLDGVAFDDHTADDPMVRHGIPFPHYDLHVWSWRDNPDGMFTSLNPNVSCEYAPTPDA